MRRVRALADRDFALEIYAAADSHQMSEYLALIKALLANEGITR